jgi:hypothetical protein
MRFNLSNFIELVYKILEWVYQSLFESVCRGEKLYYASVRDDTTSYIPKYIDDVTLIILESLIKNKNFKGYHQNLL